MNHGCVVCEKSTGGSALVTAEKSGGTRGPGKFAVAAGALLYVIIELIRVTSSPEWSKTTFVGILVGVLLMFATGLLVR